MESTNNNHGEIGHRIRDARQRKGWTQLEFALAAGISPSTVQRWERGQLPRIRELMRAAEVLGVPAATFVETIESPQERSSMERLLDAVEIVAGGVDRNEAALASLRDELRRLEVRVSDVQTALDEQRG